MADAQARIRITAQDDTASGFRQAAANLQSIQQSALAVGKSLAGVFAVREIANWSAFIINSVDALNDLRDATSASIENLSALEDIAARTGTSFDTVGTSLTKFNSVLKDAKPGTDAAAAIDAIGLSVAELKDLDPAEALRRTAVALSNFADDAGKARLVQELFGKSVRDVAPFLKDLAEKGGLVATVTTEQAAEAEKFNKQLFAMQKNLQDLSRSLVGPVLTGINGLVDRFKAGQEAGEGFIKTLLRQTEIARLMGLSTPNNGGASGTWEDPVNEYSRKRLERQGKLAVNFDGAGAKTTTGSKARAAAEGLQPVTTELERYFEALQRANAAEREFTEVAKVQRLISEAPATGFSEALRTQLLTAARLKDELRAITLEQEDMTRLARELDEGMRASEAAAQERIGALLEATPSAALQRTRSDLILLTQEFEAGRLSEERYLEAVSTRAGITATDLGKVKTASEELNLVFTSFLENTIVQGGRAGDVLKALERDIIAVVTRQYVTKPFLDGIGSAIDGGGGIGGLLGNIFKGIFGARANGGPVQAGGSYLVGERGPEIFKAPSSGTIVPTSQIGGAMGRTLNININPPAGMSRQSSTQFAADVARQINLANSRNN